MTFSAMDDRLEVKGIFARVDDEGNALGEPLYI